VALRDALPISPRALGAELEAGALGFGPAVRLPAVVDPVSPAPAGLRPTVFLATGFFAAPSFSPVALRAPPGARPTVLLAALARGLAASFTLAVACAAAF